MDAINTQGEVPASVKIIDSKMVKEPKTRSDSFYSESFSPKDGVIRTSVDHVIS